MAPQVQQAIRIQGPSLVLDHTPSGAAVVAGQVVNLGGNLAGVASEAIPDGRKGGIEAEGIFTFSKDDTAGPVFAVGDQIEWDDTNNLAVVAAGGDFDLAVCTVAAGAGDDRVEGWINKQL